MKYASKINSFCKKKSKKRCALHSEQRQMKLFIMKLKIYGKESSIVIIKYRKLK